MGPVETPWTCSVCMLATVLRLMKKFIIIFFIFLVSAEMSNAQFRYQLELGTAVGIGKNTSNVLETPGSITVVHPVNLRYKYPSLRIRPGIEYLLDDNFSVGLSTGIHIHYLDTYYYEKNKTTFSFPLQLNAHYRTNRPQTNFLFGLAGGANFMKINMPPFTDRGGSLYTAEIGLAKKEKKSKTGFQYKIGFERQTDNVLFKYEPTGSSLKPALIHYRQYRNQVFLSIVGSL